VTGQTLDIKGGHSVDFEFGGSKFSHTFLVCALPTDAAGLLGTDFMEGAGEVINFESGKMSLAKAAAIPRARVLSPTDPTALTVFTQSKEGHSPQPSQGARKVDEQSAGSRCSVTTPQNRAWLVKAREKFTIAPWCRQVVVGSFGTEKEKPLPPLVCIEPMQNPIQGHFPARALARVEQREYQSTDMRSLHNRQASVTSNRCLRILPTRN
jgi:hypothetical protein